MPFIEAHPMLHAGVRVLDRGSQLPRARCRPLRPGMSSIALRRRRRRSGGHKPARANQHRAPQVEPLPGAGGLCGRQRRELRRLESQSLQGLPELAGDPRRASLSETSTTSSPDQPDPGGCRIRHRGPLLGHHAGATVRADACTTPRLRSDRCGSRRPRRTPPSTAGTRHHPVARCHADRTGQLPRTGWRMVACSGQRNRSTMSSPAPPRRSTVFTTSTSPWERRSLTDEPARTLLIRRGPFSNWQNPRAAGRHALGSSVRQYFEGQ